MAASNRRQRFQERKQQKAHEASVKLIAKQIETLKQKLQEQKRAERGR